MLRALAIVVIATISVTHAEEPSPYKLTPQSGRTLNRDVPAKATNNNDAVNVRTAPAASKADESKPPISAPKREDAAAVRNADPVLSARDEGNGEILVEWQRQPNAVGYRIERSAAGLPTASLDVGDHTNLMDIAGLAATYSYRLLARNSSGNEREVARLSFSTPDAVLTRVRQAAGRSPRLRSAMGTNLDGITYWSPEVPFINVMKSSSDWISGDDKQWDNKQKLDLDTNGWVRSLAPGQIAQKLMLRSLANHFPGGQYLVRYKGEGTLKFQYAAHVVSEKPGEMLIDVTSGNGGGIYLRIEATNPANYMRDIEVIMPGGVCEGDPFTHILSAHECGKRRFLPFADYHNSLLFYPVFASRLRNYSVLRFMDWMATNGSPVASWSQRTTLSSHTWTAATGAPVEVMIALANRIGAHPWFTLPHQSDDAYAQNFAQTVKARLDPAFGVFVEHSNEVWNGQFPQYAYVAAQAKVQRSPIDNMQYHALRSRAIGKIFKDVLGAQRTVAVLGAQAASTYTASRGLDYLKSSFGAASLGIDAVAIAPYFAVMPRPEELTKYVAMNLDTFFDYVRREILPQAAGYTAKYRPIANSYSVHLISYEGGQHMVGHLEAKNNNALNALFDTFNRDPRMKDLYLGYLADWKKAGGELFVHFNDVSAYSKYGRWGSLEYVTQPRAAAPKFDALQTFIEQNPVWWKQ